MKTKANSPQGRLAAVCGKNPLIQADKQKLRLEGASNCSDFCIYVQAAEKNRKWGDSSLNCITSWRIKLEILLHFFIGAFFSFPCSVTITLSDEWTGGEHVDTVPQKELCSLTDSQVLRGKQISDIYTDLHCSLLGFKSGQSLLFPQAPWWRARRDVGPPAPLPSLQHCTQPLTLGTHTQDPSISLLSPRQGKRSVTPAEALLFPQSLLIMTSVMCPQPAPVMNR